MTLPPPGRHFPRGYIYRSKIDRQTQSPAIISRLGNGKFSWRASTRVGRLKCTVSHRGSSTRREILKWPAQARCCRPGMCMETLRCHLRPLLSYMVTGGGSLLDIWTVGLSARASAHVTYVTIRMCAPRSARVWKDR